MEQITDLDQIIGKTITKAREGYGDVVMIGFSDDTYLYLKSEEDDGAWLSYCQTFNPEFFIVGNDILIDFGFTTQEEIEAKAQERAVQQQRYQDEQDLKDWERLAPKFGTVYQAAA